MPVTSRYTLFYTLLFAFTAWVNQYTVWLTLPPVSIHQWRQADGAAIAWNYALNPDFWEVRICNLFYTGDAHAVGELPLLYWLSGLMSHYRGYPPYPLRWIGLLLLFAGGWAFGWNILQTAKRPLTAALGAGLLLTSPVLAYYGPNFLPDAPGFCFILIMTACLVQSDRRQSKGWLGVASMFAALGILLKLSMAIVPLALAGAWLLGKYRRVWSSASFWGGIWPALALAGTGILVLGFRWWIACYNDAHQAIYFLSAIRPVWHYGRLFIGETIAMIGEFGLQAFASAGLYLACLGGLWLSIKNRKSTPFIYRKVILLTVLGSSAYILLWFRMLREHDYYFICLLAIPAFLLLNGLRLALPQFGEKPILFALALFWMSGLGHSHYILSKRLHLAFHPQTTENLPPDAFLSADRLTEAGIPPSARVICPQDPSPNLSLLALKRQGWTAYNFGDRITADTLQKYQKNFGLTCLALRDTSAYNLLLRQFFPVRAAEVKGWYLYSY